MAITKEYVQKQFKDNQSLFPLVTCSYKQILSEEYNIGDTTETITYTTLSNLGFIKDTISSASSGYIFKGYDNEPLVLNRKFIGLKYDFGTLEPLEGDLIIEGSKTQTVKGFTTDPYEAIFEFWVN